ncbi:MAG: hypothetical protein EZS28_005957 [Streblomastix strix]|uniref:Uncharacterized protein n=1 Tax=Streblomastix strix TaxID=222440 RepID=A0A5J4WWB3_9EUKA|nr:MAG: hypothetical protein EZS28_005957 [Streblomastix strix]
MNQSQTTRNQRSQFGVNCKLLYLDDSSNLSEQQNAVELNMLSTAAETLNKEDSTEFANNKVIFAHQQSSKKHIPKRTEHGNSKIAHEKQSAVCCTDSYLQTSRSSCIAQSQFQNNIIRLIPPDIQHVMRLKLNYLKFCSSRAIHTIAPFTFDVAIQLACRSVSCIHFKRNYSSRKNNINLSLYSSNGTPQLSIYNTLEET